MKVISVRLHSALCMVGVALLAAAVCCGIAAGANEQSDKTASIHASNAVPATEPKAAPIGVPKSSIAKPLGKAPAKSGVKPLGKPKFALKTTVGASGTDAPNRSAEVKRLIDTYHNLAINYAHRVVTAKTPEQKAAAARWEPSARSVRSFARLLGQIVAEDPTDEPALDALLFLNKYVGVPEVDEVLAEIETTDGGKGLDPLALLLEHHADNSKVADALKQLPQGDATNSFLISLFEKTHIPQIRAAAGIRLVNSFQRSDREDEAKLLAADMAEDRYLDGVPVTARPTGPTARDWAKGKLRELQLLGIGQVLPDVSGQKLDGSIGEISDYRGKVVILDVWTTWCGPCVAMIPHQVEMVERLEGKPFALLSASCDADQQTLEDFLEDTAMPWEHWWIGSDGELKQQLNISAYPTVFVLDAQGVIRHKNIRGKELDDAVDKLIAEVEQDVEGL